MRSIREIDKDIDANRRELHRRLVRAMEKPQTAAAYQRAWDMFPELEQRDIELFRERWQAQLERDRKIEEMAMGLRRSDAARRAARTRKMQRREG